MAKRYGDDLRVDIKNIFENLRSCLDYLAHELFEALCGTAKKADHLYFPIRSSRIEFDKLMNRYYPGPDGANKQVFDFLGSIQPYDNIWLKQFNRLKMKTSTRI